MRRGRRVAVAVGATLVTLASAIAGVFVWASTATGTSQLARALVWGEADVDDWQRFPARPVHASPRPLTFAPSPGAPFADLRIDGTTPLEEFLESTHTTAFVVVHGDRLLYEGYFNGASRDATQTSFSVAKSFASTLIGIAIEEGAIGGLDDSVTRYVPELLERDPRFADITLRHLLTMASGLRYEDRFSPYSDGTTTYYAPDLRSAALRSVIVEPPGTRFLYNNYNPLLLGMVLERATGMSVSAYLETRLWQPMGAEADGSWSLDSARTGFEKMESGLNGRAIDFVKLGWLFLNHGRNGERQVVPAAWVAEATRIDEATDPSAGYQYFWWIDVERRAYYARGNYCQFIYVYPAANLVLLRMGRDCRGLTWSTVLADLARWLEPRLD